MVNKFLSRLFGHVEKWLDQKEVVDLKIYTSQPGKETIVIHILPNISRKKGNQKIYYDQLIEYNMGNNFLRKSYKNVLEKLFPDPFLKN